MQVCAECRVEMQCKKNGVMCTWGECGSWRRAGDLYKCPVCGIQVIKANDNGYHDEGMILLAAEYVFKMEE